MANGYSEPATHYKKEVAGKVFDDLVEAKGVKNMPVPTFRLVNTQRNVAWANPQTLEIGLEEKAYDICVSFGKDSLNALAAILSHELTHYYEKHGWTEMFSAAHPDLQSAIGSERMDEHLQQETQADYLGGFLAYSAGYHALDIMPEFLGIVYRAYGLPEVLPGYPTLQERKMMAAQSARRCRDLIHVFEMANYFVAMEDFDNARHYYKYILKDFQSRELYNNMGVASALAAMALFSKQELRFAYPIELDATSRLKSARKSGQNDKARRTSLLQEAIEFFKTAIVLDDAYASGYLNLACAYALLDEPMDAEYNARKALRAVQAGAEKTTAGVHTLLGILAAQQADKEAAVAWFDKAVEKGSIWAAFNKAVLNETPSPAPSPASRYASSLHPEKIGDLSLDKLAIDLERGRIESDKIFDISDNIQFGCIAYEHSTLFIHLSPLDGSYVLLQTTGAAYDGATARGLKAGAARQALLDAYGNPDSRTQAAQGEYLAYQKLRLICFADHAGMLKTWALFRRG